jgi:predicted enzyme related to lactoylglutathione lyase
MSVTERGLETPFEARVPAVFVPVADVPRAALWYCRLLGLPAPEACGAELHIIRLPVGVNLFLQRNEPVQPSPHVLFSLPVRDVTEAETFVLACGGTIVRLTRHPDGSTLRFRDPDGNVLLACDI